MTESEAEARAALQDLVREIEATYEMLGQEVSELRERAAHTAIEQLPEDLSSVRGRWGQLRELLQALRAENESQAQK
ncbi:hypothetical protein [Gephyromycinifex aptenodytis]|uniref:hypothetical protein n=1 Tax=Gephyromycinifex aptenodytis TaxID=2716227 RepID=UPI001444D1EB|nr:hypothetical protein [Gephyromycinifex aptenodytis]